MLAPRPAAHLSAAASPRHGVRLLAPRRLWCAARHHLAGRQVLALQRVAAQVLTGRKASGRSPARRPRVARWQMAPAGSSLARGSRPCLRSLHVEQAAGLHASAATLPVREPAPAPALPELLSQARQVRQTRPAGRRHDQRRQRYLRGRPPRQPTESTRRPRRAPCVRPCRRPAAFHAQRDGTARRIPPEIPHAIAASAWSRFRTRCAVLPSALRKACDRIAARQYQTFSRARPGHLAAPRQVLQVLSVPQLALLEAFLPQAFLPQAIAAAANLLPPRSTPLSLPDRQQNEVRASPCPIRLLPAALEPRELCRPAQLPDSRDLGRERNLPAVPSSDRLVEAYVTAFDTDRRSRQTIAPDHRNRSVPWFSDRSRRSGKAVEIFFPRAYRR